jgi:hypothetical protein
MPKLSPQDRLDLAEQKKAYRARALQLEHERVDAEIFAQVPQAQTYLNELLTAKAITVRELWLMLAVHELHHKERQSGLNRSCKTIWLDRITPRANAADFTRGVSGFTARTAAKYSAFIRGSRNGYVGLTTLGHAAVVWLLDTYPMLKGSPYHQDILVPNLGTFPAPRWRGWRD